VQHAGVIVGLSGVAGHMYPDAAPDDPAYSGRIYVTQDLSAVTGACQLMRRSLFEQLGGLDERHLAVAYNDIDFCLRVREAGLRVIYAPHARLLHHHSASRGSDIRIERLASFTWEREYMRALGARVVRRSVLQSESVPAGKAWPARDRTAPAPLQAQLGQQGLQILTVGRGFHLVGQPLQLLGGDEVVAVGDLLQAADHLALAVEDGLHIVAGLQP
jgi:hypothetical protein